MDDIAVFRPEPHRELAARENGLIEAWQFTAESRLIGAALLTASALYAARPSEYCPPRDVRLSVGQMKSRLLHTVPVQPPALGKDVRVNGFVVFVIRIDVHGDVVCIRLVSGHPLLVAPAIDSVKQWKFQAGAQPTCGKLALALSTMKPEMGLKVLDTEPPRVNGLEWRFW